MGLFSSVIHVKDVGADAVCEALTDAIPGWKFDLLEQRLMTGAPQDAPEDKLRYFVSPLQGSWSTVLEGHFAVPDEPDFAQLARSLSASLSTYALALRVHDDDVLFYNLCREGVDLDGYNSNPQYFETERLPNDAIAAQRHDPRPFTPLLPRGVSLSQLQRILDRGWWSACNAGRLDDDGVSPRDEPGFVFEGERMCAIGNLLQLHGEPQGYPFAGWAGESSIEWQKFHELQFERA